MESMTPIVFFLLFCTRGTRVILALEQSFSEQPQDVTVHAGRELKDLSEFAFYGHSF